MARTWKSEQLTLRADMMADSYQALSELQKNIGLSVSNTLQDKLAKDFMIDMQRFRKKIDALLNELSDLKQSLEIQTETSPLKLSDLNDQFDRLNQLGASLIFAWDSIVNRYNQFVITQAGGNYSKGLIRSI